MSIERACRYKNVKHELKFLKRACITMRVIRNPVAVTCHHMAKMSRPLSNEAIKKPTLTVKASVISEAMFNFFTHYHCPGSV